jgi:hypothetical protein
MVSQTRVVDWRGSSFRFERMEPMVPPREFEVEWAVSHRGEFIGTMHSLPGESTEELELRSFEWLNDLLGSARPSRLSDTLSDQSSLGRHSAPRSLWSL